MQYGLSLLSLIPVRKEPVESSEMITQILFGEHFSILKEQKGWLKIELCFDNYQGWVDNKMVEPLDKSSYNKLNESDSIIVSDIALIKEVDSNEPYAHILPGSTLPLFDKNNHQFAINKRSFLLSSGISYSYAQDPRKSIPAISTKFINTPYLWGGRSLFGIDCSGFVQVVYKIIGIKLPRDSKQQVDSGKVVSELKYAQQGDLAFFKNKEGAISHVGIILDQDTIIHASGKVRIDKIDKKGIYNIEKKKYTHGICCIKDVIN